ncbi:hypothetical protein KA013_03380 [Patescibacteria group bacterium]|nr:hypothetical protein [Patescibacteria group bacterium]
MTKLQSKRDYCSSLTSFLQRAKTITKRRVLIIVSDFLDLGEDDVALLERLDQKHIVVTYKINVPIVIGKNFDVSTSLPVPA